MIKKTHKLVINLYGMGSLKFKHEGITYAYTGPVIKKIKEADGDFAALAYKRFLWLIKFNIRVKDIYGVKAMQLENIYKDSCSGTLIFNFHDEPGEDTVSLKE